MSIDILNQEWNISKVKNKVPVRLLKSRGVKFSNTSNYYVIPDSSYNSNLRGNIFKKGALPTWDARRLQDLDNDTPCVFLSTFWSEAQSLMDTPTEEILEIYNNMLLEKADLTDMSLLSMYNAKEIFTMCKDNIEKDLNLNFGDFYNKYKNNNLVKIANMRFYRDEMTAEYRKKFNSVEMQWNLIPYAERYPIWDCMDEINIIINNYPDIQMLAEVDNYNSVLEKVNLFNEIDDIAKLLRNNGLGSLVACDCIFSLCISLLTECKIKYGVYPLRIVASDSTTTHLSRIVLYCIKSIIEVLTIEKRPDVLVELTSLQGKMEIFLYLLVTEKLPSYWSIYTLVQEIKEVNRNKEVTLLHLYK